uniref:Helicase SEN1 n=2 Tax=Anthurium amnicola TaxID=1678845 RepID=A0A1D1YSP9_9ARAE
MGSRGRPFLDLNVSPAEEEDEEVVCVQPQKLLPTTNPSNPSLSLPSEVSHRILNNCAFTHASSGSGFQPFVRSKDKQTLKECVVQNVAESKSAYVSSSSTVQHVEDNKPPEKSSSFAPSSQEVEREEGEWSDMEGSMDATGVSTSSKQEAAGSCEPEPVQKQETMEGNASSGFDRLAETKSHEFGLNGNVKDECSGTANDVSRYVSLGTEGNKKSDCNSKGDVPADGLEDPPSVVKPKDIKGIEANHALRVANNLGKRPKLDEHKEAMLGKKRNRQTVFLNIDEVKQAGAMKSSTPKRQASFSSPMATRTVKEAHRVNPPVVERAVERQAQPVLKEQRQADTLSCEGSASLDINEHKVESNGDINVGLQTRSKKAISNSELSQEAYLPPIPKQSLWKQPVDLRQHRNSQVSPSKLAVVSQSTGDVKPGNKKNPSLKKQATNSMLYQDTSVERLFREVTNDKFWHHPEETELQCVPERFESVEEYLGVFEPLLFEECRAQLYSTWEELTESVSRDVHIMVRVKAVERRERGWYDVIVLPANECKWSFKEGDVAILSSRKPTAVRSRRSNNVGIGEQDVDPEVAGRVVGTVRRYSPIDTREPPGAILHFYVGDAYDSSSKVDEDHVLRKFLPRSVWYLTVLGSLATTQREYIALHAFRHLNLQMQSAILKPSPDHFPKYEEQPPAMPECFTSNFVEYLHRTFNGPQLAAIQWAAMHTAAGSGGGMTKKQDPWPFTLVQGPPGTGKTHTVWGMLNVIHLVQYQHYYTALLKKLAPESYKQNCENNAESSGTGSIDEVLQSMDQNLFRTLPKLCPKPRMLVCAPSNAATDELLARVLGHGFIDGEMKVYRPDVARVGVDSQTRAAQAVSVERRTEQLLDKKRDEVVGWLHQLRTNEALWSQKITHLQRELNAVAAAGRSQGTVGVDPDVLVARDHNRDVLLQNLAAAVESRDKVLVEMSRLLIVEGKFRAGNNFNLEEARSKLEASFANEAEIVFTTVSSSGRKLFSRLTHGFDMVVVDEAAQASEVAVLPPLSLRAARCVLVGDPQQLPATVISKAAGTLLYSRSLFERFQQAGCPTMLLSVQYRMHPQIRDFPSRYFYQDRLTDSESVSNLTDEAYYKDDLLKPYVFFDIMHGRESHRGGSVSYQNIHEAQFCLRLYQHLNNFVKSSGGNRVSVGIITPYKLQLKCIQREFEEVLKSEEGKDLYINTVDAFQGQERDVIIMSCVRASNHGVGFVADIRRMNVALTRARRALWVVGNANALVQSDDWASLIMDAKSRKCFMDVSNIPKEFLMPKVSSYHPGKASSNLRGPRTGGQRHRQSDVHSEAKSRGHLAAHAEDEKLNVSVP